MSYINGYRVPTEQRSGAHDGVSIPGMMHDGNRVFSATDGEELGAAAQIIDMVDALENGEAIVITRVVF